MRELFQKDLRVLRPVLLAAVTLAFMFFVLLPAVNFYTSASNETRIRLTYRSLFSRGTYVDYGGMVAGAVNQGALYMWLADLALFATVGGMAFATERRERWADFAAMLPVSRWRIVAVKGAASLAVCAAIAGANWFVTVSSEGLSSLRNPWRSMAAWEFPFGYSWPTQAMCLLFATIVALGALWLLRWTQAALRWAAGIAGGALGLLIYAAATQLVFGLIVAIHENEIGNGLRYSVWTYTPAAVAIFGAAWLLSSLLSSPVLATTIALAGVGGLYAAVLQHAFERLRDTDAGWIGTGLRAWGAATLWLGVAFVIAGVVIQAHRRSP